MDRRRDYNGLTAVDGATVITAISIPTSVLITLIGMQAVQYSLNILTLGAITIAIGRVVDDSIVVTENIARHFSEDFADAAGPVSSTDRRAVIRTGCV